MGMLHCRGYKPDYMYLLQRTMMDSPDAAVNLAKMIAKQPGPPIELNVIADLFLQTEHGQRGHSLPAGGAAGQQP